PQISRPDLARNTKQVGRLNLVFLARIAKIKNLLFVLELLNNIELSNEEIILDIYGPLEDYEYWNECHKIIDRINLNVPGVGVFYKGPLNYEKVVEVIPFYDFFILPTLGENYGQSIADALSLGV